jgi:hypothetical protein
MNGQEAGVELTATFETLSGQHAESNSVLLEPALRGPSVVISSAESTVTEPGPNQLSTVGPISVDKPSFPLFNGLVSNNDLNVCAGGH